MAESDVQIDIGTQQAPVASVAARHCLSQTTIRGWGEVGYSRAGGHGVWGGGKAMVASITACVSSAQEVPFDISASGRRSLKADT